MKPIVFVINSIATGGAEKVFLLEANELHRRGLEVHMVLLFRKEGAYRLDLPEKCVHVIGMRSLYDLAGIWRTFRAIRRIQPHVIYSTLNEANTCARLISLFMPRVRLVTREANLADEKPWHYKVIDVLLGWRSHIVVCVSRAVKDSIVIYAPYLRRRMTVLHNPVALPLHAEREVHVGTRLLNVGSLTPKKNQQVLIAALSALPRDVTLTVVGDGQERWVLEDMTRTRGLESRITFAGSVPPSNVGEYYRSHDIFVLTSTREGCPNVVLEALSYGLPVIAFGIPGMDEFVSSEWGRVVRDRTPESLAQSIELLITTPDIRRKMGLAGAKHVASNHSIEQHMSELEQILKPSRT